MFAKLSLLSGGRKHTMSQTSSTYLGNQVQGRNKLITSQLWLVKMSALQTSER